MFLTVYRKTTKLLRKMIEKYPGINDLEFTKLYFTKHTLSLKYAETKGKRTVHPVCSAHSCLLSTWQSYSQGHL